MRHSGELLGRSDRKESFESSRGSGLVLDMKCRLHEDVGALSGCF